MDSVEWLLTKQYVEALQKSIKIDTYVVWCCLFNVIVQTCMLVFDVFDGAGKWVVTMHVFFFLAGCYSAVLSRHRLNLHQGDLRKEQGYLLRSLR